MALWAKVDNVNIISSRLALVINGLEFIDCAPDTSMHVCLTLYILDTVVQTLHPSHSRGLICGCLTSEG